MRSSSEYDWAAAYEELRRAALEAPDGRVQRAPGLALLRRAGLVGWMHTCRSVTGLGLPALPSREPRPAVPGAVRTEVTMLLAEMALAAAAEIAR